MTQEKSDYYNLQTELYRIYNRKRYLLIFLIVGIILGIISFVYGVNNNLPIINTIITALFIAFIAFFILILSNLAWINMNQSDHEERMVKGGIEYLSKKPLSKKRMEVIGKRAEIGSNAFSSRTILPLAAIPFLLTYFSGKISSETQFFIAIVIILIGMSFILELDRANMDILIRQIYVSYIPAKREKKVNEK
jgi:hypothetical protein